MLPKDKDGLAKFQKIQHAALRAMMTDDLPAASDVEVVAKTKRVEKDGVRVGEVVLSRKGQGERVAVAIVRGNKFDGTGVIWVHPEGATSLWKDGKLVPAAQAIVDKGAGILALNAFRTGPAGKEERPTTNMVVSKLAYAGYFYGYNRALVAERVHDILTVVAMTKADPGSKAIHIVGFEKAGPWVLLARGLCGEAIGRTAADVNGFRFERVKDFDDEMMLPGALKYGGLLALAGTIAPHDLYLHNNEGGSPRVLLEAAYSAAGQSKRLQYYGEEKDAKTVVQWLLP
jgi:hypothetical protein